VDEGFLEAVVHKRAPLLARARGYSGHIVLGRRLRPFEFWHQQLLQGIDSPFLSPEPPRTPPSSIQLFKNLYLATEICRVKFPHVPPRTGWRAIVRRKLAVLRWYIRLGIGKPRGHRMISLLIEAAKFRFYLGDYSSFPIPARNRKNKPVQSPVALYQMSLFRRYHPRVSIAEAWQMSPGDVSWQNTASQEADGVAIEIMTDARLRARREAIRKGKEAQAKKDATNGNGNGASNERR
jgi:hypothetical protein